MRRAPIILTVAFSFLTACANYTAPEAKVLSEQSSMIAATCTQIMGLKQGEYYYSACQDSLARSLAAYVEGEARLTSYDNCRRQGLMDGSAALSMCILDKQYTSHAVSLKVASASPAPLAYPHDDLDAGESYYNVTPATHWRREQYSCAQLGLLPGSAAFGHCVASLDANLQPDSP